MAVLDQPLLLLHMVVGIPVTAAAEAAMVQPMEIGKKVVQVQADMPAAAPILVQQLVQPHLLVAAVAHLGTIQAHTVCLPAAALAY